MLQFLHESIYTNVLDQLVGLYKQVKIGNPLEKGTLVGPLHTRTSVENFQKGISVIKSQACSCYSFLFELNIKVLSVIMKTRMCYIQKIECLYSLWR